MLRCFKHGKKCSRKFVADHTGVPLEALILTMLVAGSARTDFSAYGNKQTSAGPTTLFLLILLRMILDWKPMIFLHENVLQFPLTLLEEILGELYQFEEHILCPQHAGFPVDRRRKYCIGRFSLKLRSPGIMLRFILLV